MFRPAGCLLLALVAGASAAEPAGSGIELLPAWHGYQRPYRVSELAVAFSTRQAARVQVTLRRGRVTVHHDTTLTPGHSHRINLPLPSAAGDDVHVVVNGGPEQLLRMHRVPGGRPLLAALLPGAADPAPTIDGAVVVPVAADALPRHRQAYDAIDALVLDESGFLALEPAQLQALLDYLADCGPVVLATANPQLLQQFEAAAGCQGRWSRSADDLRAAVDTIPAWLAGGRRGPWRMPVSTATGHDAIPTLGLLLSAWFVAGVTLVLLRVRPVFLALYPALGCLALLPAWTHREATVTFNDVPGLRTVQVDGFQPGHSEFVQSASWGVPVAIDPPVDLELDVDLDAGQFRFRLPSTLLSRHRLYYHAPTRNGA